MLDTIKDGCVRSTIGRTKIPNVNKHNTIMMKELHSLYGSARYTDAQIAYFFIKWQGNYTQSALELGCSAMTMWHRVQVLSRTSFPTLISMFGNARKKRKSRSDKKVSDEDFIAAVNGSKSIRQTARILGVYPNSVVGRAKTLGIKLNKRWER